MRGVRRSFADHPVENEAAQTLQSEQKRRAFLLPMGEEGVRRHSGRAPEEFCAFEQTAIGRGGQEAAGQGARQSRRQRAMAVCRSEEHASELQSLMRISYAVFCLKKKKKKNKNT